MDSAGGNPPSKGSQSRGHAWYRSTLWSLIEQLILTDGKQSSTGQGCGEMGNEHLVGTEIQFKKMEKS